MNRFAKLISIALIILSLMTIVASAMAAELSVTDGGTDKYLFNISNRTTAPTFSVRAINTPAANTAQVDLNYNDLTKGTTYFMYSNSIGLSGSSTEKTLREDGNNFSFVSGRSTRAQIVLTSSDGDFSIRFYMN